MMKTIKIAFPLTIPVLLGYISVGIPFGLLVVKSGLSIWVALSMSLFVYAGAMQFVAIPLLLNPIGLIQTALVTLFVNIRHLFYGLSFIDDFMMASGHFYQVGIWCRPVRSRSWLHPI